MSASPFEGKQMPIRLVRRRFAAQTASLSRKMLGEVSRSGALSGTSNRTRFFAFDGDSGLLSPLLFWDTARLVVIIIASWLFVDLQIPVGLLRIDPLRFRDSRMPFSLLPSGVGDRSDVARP